MVSDVNDNPPVFVTQNNTAALPEDAEIGTLVTKIHATDADIGNRVFQDSCQIERKMKF